MCARARVCVYVCARARVRVCVCVYLPLADDEEGVSPGSLSDDVLSIFIMGLDKKQQQFIVCVSVNVCVCVCVCG